MFTFVLKSDLDDLLDLFPLICLNWVRVTHTPTLGLEGRRVTVSTGNVGQSWPAVHCTFILTTTRYMTHTGSSQTSYSFFLSCFFSFFQSFFVFLSHTCACRCTSICTNRDISALSLSTQSREATESTGEEARRGERRGDERRGDERRGDERRGDERRGDERRLEENKGGERREEETGGGEQKERECVMRRR